MDAAPRPAAPSGILVGCRRRPRAGPPARGVAVPGLPGGALPLVTGQPGHGRVSARRLNSPPAPMSGSWAGPRPEPRTSAGRCLLEEPDPVPGADHGGLVDDQNGAGWDVDPVAFDLGEHRRDRPEGSPSWWTGFSRPARTGRTRSPRGLRVNKPAARRPAGRSCPTPRVRSPQTATAGCGQGVDHRGLLGGQGAVVDTLVHPLRIGSWGLGGAQVSASVRARASAARSPEVVHLRG